jgi:hypothetical protein
VTQSHTNGPIVGAPAAAPALAPPDYAGQPAPAGAAATGLVARLKLTEPVRLYLYSVVGVVDTGLVLAGVLTGDWPAYVISAAATLLGVAGATEAARASTYSLASALRLVRRVGQAGTVAKGLDL